MFPKKVILAITSHGWIHCDTSNPETFTIPEGIVVNKVSMSTPGNVNFLDTEQIEEAIKEIKKQKRRLLMSKKQSTIQYTIESIRQSIKKQDYEEKTWLESERKENVMPSNSDDIEEYNERKEQINDYINGLDKGHNKYTLNPGDTAVNKRYERKNDETTHYDWVMSILNMPGDPDLLQLMKIQTRRGSSSSSLSEVIDYLKENGVTEIIIFDFSCSVFLEGNIKKDDLYKMSQRETRSIRRNFTKENTGYGIKHKKTKKHKTKFHKKSLKNTHKRKTY